MKLTIKNKLIIYAVSIFLILNLIGAFTQFANSRISEYDLIQNDLNSIWSKTLQLRVAEKNYILRETRNPDYFRTNESNYINEFDAQMNSIDSLLDQLKNFDLMITEQKQAKIFGVSNLLNRYKHDFDSLTKAIYVKGFKDYGMIGEMRSKIHDLEGRIGADHEKVYMLTLRRHEKDYLLRSDPKYRDRLNSIYAEMRGQVLYNPELVYSLDEYNKIFNQIVDLDKRIGYSDTTGMYGQLYKTVSKVEPAVSSLLKEEVRRSQQQQHGFLISIYGVILIGIAISVIASLIVIRSINKSVDLARKVINKVSKGKLNFEVEDEGRDEIGELIKDLMQMVIKVKEVVQVVVNSSNFINTTSRELSNSSGMMSDGASQQASSAEEISSSMEQMTSSIHQNSDYANETKEIAVEGASFMTESKELVSKTTDSMNSITNKISVIEEISRKTNILALNAAIEAARAGVHGKGFAVVSAEIRRLAERTQEAANEIDKESAESIGISQRSKELILQTLPHIERTSELVLQISSASNDQNSGAIEINSALNGLSQTIQQNAAIAEQMEANSKELYSHANALIETISFFDVQPDKLHGIRRKESSWKKRMKRRMKLAS